MPKLVFDAYDVSVPYFEQKSNVAYMMLTQAIMNTDAKPESPRSAREWVSMSKIMEAFASLEELVVERVMTPEGEKEVSVSILKSVGGSFDLDEDTFEMLKNLWNIHVEKNLNLSHARQVVITKDFLKSAELNQE